MKTPENFTEYLSKHAIPWDDDKARSFRLFFEHLVSVNERLNLTRITDKEEVYTKHFLDSLSILTLPLNFNDKTVCDVGSGGGFPGIPLAITHPDLQVTSVESTGKKVAFQKSLIETLKLDNVFPLHERVETLSPDIQFDYVTSRAVARLSILVELTYRLVRVGGSMIFLKGPKHTEELVGSEKIFNQLGLKLDIHSVDIDENERTILVIKKTKDIPIKNRPYGAIKNSPLW